jgi:hypothetical protein
MENTVYVGVIMIGLALVFWYNYQAMARGASKFYTKLYTEKNMRVMFRVVAIILGLTGFHLVFFN